MRRWLALTLGLVVAGAAGYALLSVPPAGEPASAVGQPQDEIGEDSRAELEAILQDADTGAGDGESP